MLYKRKIKNNCIGFFQAKKLTIKWNLPESLTFQNLLKSYYQKLFRKLLPAESLEISWLLTNNLKQSYYHLHQQTILLKIIYIMTLFSG